MRLFIKPLILLSCLIFSCNKTPEDGRIDENERTIMETCLMDSWTSKTQIESNLIGEWRLIGHGEGWNTAVEEPSSKVVIEENQLELQFNREDTEYKSSHTWTIEAFDWPNNQGQYFKLILDPLPQFHWSMQVFCEQYMYQDDTPLDGNMYLYRKEE